MSEESHETTALAVEESGAAMRRRLLAEIAACRADPMKMLMHQRPITMAIMMALTRPASEVLDLAEEGFTTTAATDMSAIEALGIAAVGSALRGSTNAASFITERLESRTDEISPESLAARQATTAAIGEVIQLMTDAKLKLGADNALPGGPASVQGSRATSRSSEA
ncbi:MAG: hypothetical protein NTV97_28700 [Alphaproteobacteria bacterium]|nr:hypothetical protein [Alphaproteobacteria bacterium]